MNKQMSNNKRIVKNTIMLYIRMIVIMLVTLYTSRVILQVLGIQDYGIYNIVGSVVISLSFIQSALNSATQRYISYEIGKGKEGNVASIFSMSLNIQCIFLFIILLAFETIGLWVLNCILSIPTNRTFAANVAFQFSVLTFCINMVRVPYNAMLISYERMNAYAILSIAEAMLRLLIVYVLLICQHDKLIEYSILVFLVTLSINVLYIVYCKKRYHPQCVYKYNKNKQLLKKMIGFSGWNLIGGITGMAALEGPNYFMNIYLGVGVNAAMGVAKQVGSAVYTFTENFQTAFRPQIVKYYAANRNEELNNLVFNASKISYYLLFVIGIPIILNINNILELWLTDVPLYTSEFTVCMLLGYMVNAISSPLWMLAHATGNIKKYQLWISGISCLILPVTWIILILKYEPYYITAFQILVNTMIFLYRLVFAREKTRLSIPLYVRKVLFPCGILSVATLMVLIIFKYLLFRNLWIVSMLSSFIIASTIFLIFGIPKDYRTHAYYFVKNKIYKL